MLLGESHHVAHLREGAPDGGHEAGLVRHGTEAERDGAAVQADDDHQALPGHVVAGRDQGRLGADEVDDRGPVPREAYGNAPLE